MFFSRQIGLSDAGDAIPDSRRRAGDRPRRRYSIGALNIQQRAEGPVPSTNFTAIRVAAFGARQLRRRCDGPEQGRRRAPAYNRVAGVDANLRFGRWPGRLWREDGRAAATVPGSGEDFSARANFNYQSRTWMARGAYETIGRRFRDELGFVPRIGVNHRAAYARATSVRTGRRRIGIREIGPHLHFDQFDRRERQRHRVAVLRLARRADDERQRLLRERRESEPSKEPWRRSR